MFLVNSQHICLSLDLSPLSGPISLSPTDLPRIFLPLIIWTRLKPPSTLSASLVHGFPSSDSVLPTAGPPTNPQQMPERLFGWLRAVDRQHGFKCENKAISSRLCRDGNAWVYRQRAGRGKLTDTFFALVWHSSPNLSTQKCFVRTARGKMQTFCACLGEGFYPETSLLLQVDIHTKISSYWSLLTAFAGRCYVDRTRCLTGVSHS